MIQLSLPANMAPKPSRQTVMLCTVLLSCLSGCHQTMYTTSSLPIRYAAIPTADRGAIDISQLTGPPQRTDLIVPGDLIGVSITTGLEEKEPTSWPLRVAENGTVNIPVVGPVRVVGMTLPQAEQFIQHTSIERGKYVHPTIAVVLEDRQSNVVTVIGAVNKPGQYNIPDVNSNVLAAIVAAEGLHEDAGTIVEIWHPVSNTVTDNSNEGSIQPATFTDSSQDLHPSTTTNSPDMVHQIDLAAPSPDVDVSILDGTVVKVRPQSRQTIQVIGLVKKPDVYDLQPGEEYRLLDAIALAGGRRLQLADKVRIIRRTQDSNQLITIAASVRSAKQNSRDNIRLTAGDVVSVEETPTTFTLETLRSFIRFGFTSGIPGF